MEPISITSTDDPRVADYIDIRDPESRRRIEGDEFFIAEGINVIERLLVSRFTLRSVLLTPNRYARMEPSLREATCPIYVADREVLAKVAGFDLHRGAVAAADRGTPLSLTMLLDGWDESRGDGVESSGESGPGSGRTLAVLEGLNDPENLGAIARSARALGVDGLVLDPTCADPFYRRTVRVSMGEILFLPTVRSTDWTRDLDLIAAAGFRLLALTPSRSAVPIGEVRRVLGDRVVLLLGAEGTGLTERTLTRSERVRIPLRSGVDSLNVGHAAAIAFALLSPVTP